MLSLPFTIEQALNVDPNLFSGLVCSPFMATTIN